MSALLADRPAADARTLRDALEETYRKRWAGTRSEKTTMSQAEAMAGLVASCMDLVRFVELKQTRRDPLAAFRISAVAEVHVRQATAMAYAQGLSPATINKRLNCLSAMGVSVCGCRVREPQVLKWWLRPEDEAKVVDFLHDASDDLPEWIAFASFILWTTRTGLRVEESLKLRWSDFSSDGREVLVNGTKTANAQATLALGSEVAGIIRTLKSLVGGEGPFLSFDYEQAKNMWTLIRRKFGWQDIPTATLKSLRRSAARYLHYDRGMPLDMVRQYLRHENIETTMGYLRLTGGVSLEEQRRYLG